MLSSQEIRTLLFVELLGGIGDLLIALPAIQALGRSHPNARLTVLTFAPGGELLRGDPGVDQVVFANRGQPRLSLETLLNEQFFDVIVSDTTYDGIADLINKSQANVKITNLWRSPPADERVSDRFVDILRMEGLITEAAIAQPVQLYLQVSQRRSALQSLGAAYRPLIFLIPDAGMPIKKWAAQNFVDLGQSLQRQYEGATIRVVVGADAVEAEQIAAQIEGAEVWRSPDLCHLAAALNVADLVVAADTGPARIAAAVHTPTLTLFGPSWHGRYGQPAPHINLQGFPDCPERRVHNFTEQSCWYSNTCPYDWKTCLDDLDLETVIVAANQLLNQKLSLGLPELPELSELSPQILRKTEADHYKTPQSVHFSVASQTFSDSDRETWKKIRRLLVMRLDNIGDVIMTGPALRALRHSLPEAKITLMTSPGGAQVQPLLPWVDAVLPWRALWQDLGRLPFDPAREWQLVEMLQAQAFDAAIIFTSFSQSPHPAATLCALAGIPLRLGESKEWDRGTLTHAVPPAPDAIHQVDRNLRLIEAVGLAVEHSPHSAARALQLQIPVAAQHSARALLPAAARPYLLLNPWTSCQSRNYNAERFAIAAHQLSQITAWSVVVTGVEKDRDRAAPLLKILGNCAVDLIGKTDLAELVALVAGAKLVLTNNTSTMHIADATCTPNVILFAGTELESQWYPRHSPSRLLRRSTVCSPCYAFHCPYQLECLDIAPETVVDAALNLLSLYPNCSSVRLNQPQDFL